MGFADELAKARGGKESVVTEAASEVAPETKTETQEPQVSPDDFFNQGMPKDGDTLAESKEQKAPPVVPEPAKTQTKIRIGTQTFNSQEEALAYAEDLEMTRIREEAFLEGKESTKPKEEEKPKRTIDDEIEEKIFENPKEAIQKLRESLKAEIAEETRKAEAEKAKIAAAEAGRKKAWEDFYSQNSDLGSQQEVVQFVLQKNWTELGPMKADEALKELAVRTRKFLDSAKESRLPTQELQSRATVTTGASGDATTTAEKKEPKALDFISQVNKHRKRSQ